MKSSEISTFCQELKRHLLDGITHIFNIEKTKDKQTIHFVQPHTVNGVKHDLHFLLKQNNKGALLYSQVSKSNTGKSPKFLNDLTAEGLLNILLSLEKQTGLIYDNPFTWLNTGEENAIVAIEIEGGNVQSVYSTSDRIGVTVVDIDNMKATDPGEEYTPGIFIVEVFSHEKMNTYLESATKIIE